MYKNKHIKFVMKETTETWGWFIDIDKEHHIESINSTISKDYNYIPKHYNHTYNCKNYSQLFDFEENEQNEEPPHKEDYKKESPLIRVSFCILSLIFMTIVYVKLIIIL